MGRKKKAPPDSEQAKAIYAFGLGLLPVLQGITDAKWEELLKTKTHEDVVMVLKDVPFGYKLMGGASPGHHAYLPKLVASAVNERDRPKLTRTKQERYIAFSIAAEGRFSSRESRKICHNEERYTSAPESNRA